MRDVRLRQVGPAEVARDPVGDLVAQLRRLLEVRPRGVRVSVHAIQLGQEHVRLAQEVLFAGRPSQGESLLRRLHAAVPGRALIVRLQERDLGVRHVFRRELARPDEHLLRAREVPILERDARAYAVRFAEEVGVGRRLQDRGFDLTPRVDRVAARQGDPRRNDIEMRGAPRRDSRPQDSPAERERVLRVIEQAEDVPERREVGEDPRRRHPIAHGVQELDRALPVLERRAVLVALEGEVSEVRQRVRARPRLVATLPFGENGLEQNARLFREPLREKSDPTIEASAKLRGAVLLLGGEHSVFGEVAVRLVPLRLGQKELAEHVPPLENG